MNQIFWEWKKGNDCTFWVTQNSHFALIHSRKLWKSFVPTKILMHMKLTSGTRKKFHIEYWQFKTFKKISNEGETKKNRDVFATRTPSQNNMGIG